MKKQQKYTKNDCAQKCTAIFHHSAKIFFVRMYDLIELRNHYGANDVLPGLTGWAQVNGRDELEIDVKAKLDGEYCKNLSFSFDVKCFFMTIFSVLKHDGVVEGGTGSIHNKDNNN